MYQKCFNTFLYWGLGCLVFNQGGIKGTSYKTEKQLLFLFFFLNKKIITTTTTKKKLIIITRVGK